MRRIEPGDLQSLEMVFRHAEPIPALIEVGEVVFQFESICNAGDTTVNAFYKRWHQLHGVNVSVIDAQRFAQTYLDDFRHDHPINMIIPNEPLGSDYRTIIFTGNDEHYHDGGRNGELYNL